MPRQTISRPRKGGRGATGGSKKKRNAGGTDESFTEPTPRLKLLLKPPQGKVPASGSVVAEDSADVDEQLPVKTTRSGRVVKAKKDDDFLYSEGYNSQLTSSPPRKVDDDGGDVDYQHPAIYNLPTRHQPTIPGLLPNKRPNSNPLQPVLDPVVEEQFPSSSTVHASSPPAEFSLIQTDRATVLNILELLTQTAKIHIDLPDLNYRNSDIERPYSAAMLLQLYLEAYDTKKWDICDLVADTWIRAFHALRRREELRGRAKRAMTWRYNEPLLKRREQGIKGFEPNPPTYSHVLHVQDPEVESDVTSPPINVLNALFLQTAPECGARNLWADALALSGDKLSDRMAADKRTGEKWHPDLVYEIARTGARLVGKKLTLKIEEAVEGAWCKRYHEHVRRGQKCYREKAYERRMEGLDADEEESEEDGDVVMAGGRGEGVTGEGTRVRFELGEPEVIDVDAEGETDDE